MDKSKRRKIVKIEPIVRDKEDFMIKPKVGYSELRMKNSNRKIERSLEDRLAFNARGKNHCVMCDKEATKMVYLDVKGGGALQLEKYCDQCFENFIDLDKMELKLWNCATTV